MRLLSREESEYMGIAEIMKFDDSVRMTRMNWWMIALGLMVLQLVAGIVMALVTAIPDFTSSLIQIVVLWVSLGVWVGRLRDRGYTEAMEFALRIIIFPWGFVECGFLAGPEPADE